MEFKKGDEVKFFDDYSSIPHYGTIIIVREKTCTVMVQDPCGSGRVERVNVQKKNLNWD